MTQHHPARYWSPDEDQRIVCNLCPRHCRLNEGQRAFCFVRQNVGGEMVLTTYGLSTGFCIDPIEKKPLNHFYPGSAVLSFGTAGCNLGCRFCQNWDMSKAREVEGISQRATPEAIAQAAADNDCKSVAFTYNDPVIFAEYAMDTAHACHQLGIKTVAVTAGYISPEARPDFFGAMDAANVDLKAFSERFYKKLCSAALAPVLDTLAWLHRETEVWLEVTTLLIPGENDDADELARLCDWHAETLGPDTPLHFSAFHPDFKLRDRPRTPATTIKRACELARAAGLRYVYTGNIHDPSGQSTTCHACGALLVERDGYQIGTYAMDSAGRCAHCQEPIAGRFDGEVGSWGSGRQRVRP